MRACVIPLLMLAFATACNDGSPGRTAQANAGPPDGGADAGIDATDQAAVDDFVDQHLDPSSPSAT